MKMKSYQADTMQEALALVKDEMGPDAVILKSRRTTRKVGGKTQPCFEVTAALEESLFARPAPVTADRQAPRNARSVESRQRSESDEPGPARAFTPAGRVPEPGRSAPRRAPAGSPAVPAAPGQYDWRGS